MVARSSSAQLELTRSFEASIVALLCAAAHDGRSSVSACSESRMAVAPETSLSGRGRQVPPCGKEADYGDCKMQSGFISEESCFNRNERLSALDLSASYSEIRSRFVAGLAA